MDDGGIDADGSLEGDEEVECSGRAGGQATAQSCATGKNNLLYYVRWLERLLELKWLRSVEVWIVV